MGETIIARRPPNDGADWDCQCARCGSSMNYEHCVSCGGLGWTEDDENHFCASRVTCADCGGDGGWVECLSGVAWCEAHPLPGCEGVKGGTAEWFRITPAAEVDRG